ncbi:MAG: ATP-binding protein [Kiritimatiellia bacterium]
MLAFRDMPIRMKLRVITMAIVAFALLLTGSVFTICETLTFRQVIRDDVGALAEIIAINCKAPLSFDDPAAAARLMSSLAVRQRIVAAAVYSDDGRLFAEFRRPNNTIAYLPPTLKPDDQPNVRRHMVFVRPVMRDNKCIGTVYLCCSLQEYYTRLVLYSCMVLVMLLGTLLVTFALCDFMQRGISGPILSLADAAAAVTRCDNYSVRTVKSGNDELGLLTDAFNLMLTTIEEREAALRRSNEQLQVEVQERIRTQRDLAQEKERLAVTLGSIGDAVIATDTAGRIVLFNRTAEELTGWTPADACGRAIPEVFRIVNEETRQPCQNPVDRVLELGIVVGLANHTVLLAKDGRELAIADSGAPILDNEGQIIGVVLVFRDVSERTRMEKSLAEKESQLRHAQKMEAVGRLAGGIAHDFNNLLGVIIGFGSIVEDSLPAQDETMRANMREIMQSADRAAVLTQQLLAVSRKKLVDTRPVDLNRVVMGFDKLLRRTIGEDIELVTLPTGDCNAILADVGALEQVILNLAINARDAMPRGGKLTIQVDPVLLTEGMMSMSGEIPPGEYVCFQVQDTGIGMTNEVRQHVFEPFYTTKTIGRGTGLGLSAVYGIVKQFNGFIVLESTLGIGTTFSIYFPRLADTAIPPSTDKLQHDEGIPRGTETILVVEDNASIRSFSVKVLGSLGYHVLEASNGQKALEICQQYEAPLHLILSDIVMPFMSGPEFVHLAGKVRHDFRVLFTSGFSDNVAYNDIDIGAFAILPKPFSQRVLAARVRKVLDNHDQA